MPSDITARTDAPAGERVELPGGYFIAPHDPRGTLADDDLVIISPQFTPFGRIRGDQARAFAAALAPDPSAAGVAVPGIYIASKAVHGPRWRWLRAAGHPIISTWIDEAEQGRTTDWADLWMRCLREASAADVTIVYREDGEELKGARLEVGAALAHGRQVIVVGDVQDTWTRHPNVTRVESMNVATAYAGVLIRSRISAEDRTSLADGATGGEEK